MKKFNLLLVCAMAFSLAGCQEPTVEEIVVDEVAIEETVMATDEATEAVEGISEEVIMEETSGEDVGQFQTDGRITTDEVANVSYMTYDDVYLLEVRQNSDDGSLYVNISDEEGFFWSGTEKETVDVNEYGIAVTFLNEEDNSEVVVTWGDYEAMDHPAVSRGEEAQNLNDAIFTDYNFCELLN